MNQLKEAFYKEYSRILEQNELPERFQDEFILEDCLGSNEHGETYLFRKNDTDLRYVVKVRDKEHKYRIDIEEKLLNRLQEMDFPAPRLLKRVDTEDKIFLVREYIEGQTLEQYYCSMGEWSEWETAEIGMAVCEQLMKLHNASPPIIHRDIKPQNIVITPAGKVWLIDFDTARIYEEGKEQDTYLFGTSQTAAPEQYGFEQTDVRTDLYGLGKTLLYLACGSYDSAALENAQCSFGFKTVIRKSISILKDQRYRSAEELYRQLDKCRRAAMHRKGRIFLGVSALLLILVLFCAGSMRYWQARENRTVVFESQVLENAVREALHFDKEKEITYADLKNVYELRVIGNAPLEADSTYYYRQYECPDHNPDDKYKAKGDIADISLLASMPNLKEVYLCNQNITDIMPLKSLELTVLALSENYIKDFSVISQMDTLTKLYIGDNPVKNVDFLEGNTTLRLLNLGSTDIESLKPLTDTQIEELWIMGCDAMDEDYTYLTGMPRLMRLYVGDFTVEQMQSLNGCNHLQELYLWGEKRSGATDLTCLNGVDNLRILFLSNNISSVEGIGNLKGLKSLLLGGYTDLAALTDNSGLQELNMYATHASVPDYTSVIEHPGLLRIICSEEQKEEMLKLRPDMKTIVVETW